MPSGDDVLNKLRAILVDLSGLDLWPPWDAAQTLVDAVSRVLEVAGTPPAPDPEEAREASADWGLVGRRAARARQSLVDLRDGVGPDVWQGDAGSSFRSSLHAFAGRADTLEPAAAGVATALSTFATSMAAARTRHQEAFDGLREHLEISWGDLNPLALKDKIAGILEEVIAGVRDLIGAYEDAGDAHAACREAVTTAMDGVDLPQAVPEGVSAIDAVSAWEDHDGPLAGDVIDRFNLASERLGAADREALADALAAARSDEERGWIMAGVASGLTGAALVAYLRRLRSMTPTELADLDPGRHRLKQPNGTTCGSSSLVMARMRNDPAYAMWMTTGYDPRTGEVDPGTAQERFAREAEEMQDRTNTYRDRDGDLQVPYPKFIGTAPWALANEMSANGGSGVPGTEYDARTIDPDDRRSTYREMTAAVEDGHSVPMYVGNSVAPAHIVLVTGVEDGRLRVYDPASGNTVRVSREQFVAGELPFGSPSKPLDLAGKMTEPWFVVVPR